jgi:hypothetical protein
MDRNAAVSIETRLLEQRGQDCLVANKRDGVERCVLGERELHRRNHFGRTQIPTHRVDRDAASRARSCDHRWDGRIFDCTAGREA